MREASSREFTPHDLFRFVSGDLEPTRAAEIEGKAAVDEELAAQIEFMRMFAGEDDEDAEDGSDSAIEPPVGLDATQKKRVDVAVKSAEPILMIEPASAGGAMSEISSN